jgi:hypothetical protein
MNLAAMLLGVTFILGATFGDDAPVVQMSKWQHIYPGFTGSLETNAHQQLKQILPQSEWDLALLSTNFRMRPKPYNGDIFYKVAHKLKCRLVGYLHHPTNRTKALALLRIDPADNRHLPAGQRPSRAFYQIIAPKGLIGAPPQKGSSLPYAWVEGAPGDVAPDPQNDPQKDPQHIFDDKTRKGLTSDTKQSDAEIGALLDRLTTPPAEGSAQPKANQAKATPKSEPAVKPQKRSFTKTPGVPTQAPEAFHIAVRQAHKSPPRRFRRVSEVTFRHPSRGEKRMFNLPSNITNGRHGGGRVFLYVSPAPRRSKYTLVIKRNGKLKTRMPWKCTDHITWARCEFRFDNEAGMEVFSLRAPPDAWVHAELGHSG